MRFCDAAVVMLCVCVCLGGGLVGGDGVRLGVGCICLPVRNPVSLVVMLCKARKLT